MKFYWAIFVVVCAMLLGRIAGASTATPEPLTSLHAIHALSNAEADRSIPVSFEATVTYYKKGDVDLFVQEGDDAIYVETTPNADLITGDRIRVDGRTRASFRPEIRGDSITFLHHGLPPNPVDADFRQLIRTELDCKRVRVHAVVRSANSILDNGLKSIYLQLLMDGGNVDAEVLDTGEEDLTELLDAEVELTGAVAGKFDSKMQMVGVLLEVPAISDLKILKRPQAVPDSLPVTPMDEVLRAYDIQDRTQRVRVEGTITYYQPGSALVLQNGAKSLWITTQFEQPMQIGQVASVTGFPDVRGGSLTLTRAAIQATGVQSRVSPLLTSSTELASGTHAFDLVSVEGRLLTAIREAAQDEYVLVADGHLFSAVYRHPERGLNISLPEMKRVAVGSAVHITGICVLDRGDKFQGPVAFEVLIRSSDDIAVTAPPSLLNVRNLTILVGFLLLAMLAIGARGWLIERRVRRQTSRLARFEQRRSRILEHINGSQAVAGILDEITNLVSFKLNGAACWCTTPDGGRHGNCPPKLGGLRVVETAIPGRSGQRLGSIFAAFDERGRPAPDESKTFALAAELAKLAIETHRLYSDLMHRSEFDLLTDVHNRFSLDSRLDSLIDETQAPGGFFGLIYIDLDGFKQINDLYGHRVGDIYLQKVVMRMKHQIRPADLFARLGGDEFAVVVSTARNEDEVREIGLRLARCFDEPFEIEGRILDGDASFGVAFYPASGGTRDSLLNAADADMYARKRAKRDTQAGSRPLIA